MLSSLSVCVDLPVFDRRVGRLRRMAAVVALGIAGCLASLPSHAMVELTGITKIAAGFGHTCALTEAGGVKCWGRNDDGELGDNSMIQRLTPVDVSGLTSGVRAIATEWNHTCALTAAGGVKCWGSNLYGQLGDNTTIQRLTPVDVSGLESGVAAVTVGSGRTCALTTAGGVKCWGDNSAGQLGDNTTSSA
jgi:alpha-tubulin suppressor-like RCC1 family protein